MNSDDEAPVERPKLSDLPTAREIHERDMRDDPEYRREYERAAASRPVFAYDGDVNALYYSLTGKPVARTIDIDGRVTIDVDADGKAVGIEVLDPPGFSMGISYEAESMVPLKYREGGQQ